MAVGTGTGNSARSCRSWQVDPALIRASPKCGRAGAPDLVDAARRAAATGASGVVAGLLSLRASTRVVTAGAEPANRARRQASAPALPPTDTRDGGRSNESPVDRP